MVRASTRVRKPSQRAREAGYTSAPHSQVTEKRELAKRKTTPKPRKPRAASGKGKGKQKEEVVERPVFLTVLREEDERAVCLLLELASAALAPDFKTEVEVDLEARRRAFYAKLQN
ncbi:hypothetical protein D8B26_004516 [Coccidioides posadasii str. Silveira]|uniref:Uncharacterized protein n=2 Tax=Coccidioides posadasii TaxID=199306 RepID=E9DES5_COCPS|nr:conserved hypothetical protein [Coccidioides posadasii str. Silveira]KMM68913.1 hypothetical protein CPAG_05236 [Coccidioides posadasii RMSCC 3488]QVM09856.1 hypothetical protein D8B26_004516 [Coccidioides posadasii str. Silveira]